MGTVRNLGGGGQEGFWEAREMRFQGDVKQL